MSDHECPLVIMSDLGWSWVIVSAYGWSWVIVSAHGWSWVQSHYWTHTWTQYTHPFTFYIAYHLGNRLCINMLYPCTFISCAQVWLEWLSSQQRTRTFYSEHRQLGQVTTLVTLLGESLRRRLWKDETIHLLMKIDVTINFDGKTWLLCPTIVLGGIISSVR